MSNEEEVLDAILAELKEQNKPKSIAQELELRLRRGRVSTAKAE